MLLEWGWKVIDSWEVLGGKDTGVSKEERSEEEEEEGGRDQHLSNVLYRFSRQATCTTLPSRSLPMGGNRKSLMAGNITCCMDQLNSSSVRYKELEAFVPSKDSLTPETDTL